MSTTDVDGLARTAENWLTRRGKHEPDLADPETAWGRCVIETQRLVDYINAPKPDRPLRLIRATGQTYPGREHWAAVGLDEEHPEDSPVVDVTLRQFLPDATIPWTGTLPDWYDEIVDGIRDHLDVAVHDDPQDTPYWTDTYARDDFEPGDLQVPWRADSNHDDDDADDMAAG